MDFIMNETVAGKRCTVANMSLDGLAYKQLRHQYGFRQVDEIFSLFMEDFIRESYQRAVDATSFALQKRFDTSTACLIGTNTSDRPIPHPLDCAVSLYQQRDGTYFMVSEGGPGTMDNSKSSGKRIFAVTEAEAREWAEKYCHELVID